MIEITNKTKSPVQLVIRSRKAVRAFTTKVLPGIGTGKNVYLLEDERATEYIDRIENLGFITIRKIQE